MIVDLIEYCLNTFSNKIAYRKMYKFYCISFIIFIAISIIFKLKMTIAYIIICIFIIFSGLFIYIYVLSKMNKRNKANILKDIKYYIIYDYEKDNKEKLKKYLISKNLYNKEKINIIFKDISNRNISINWFELLTLILTITFAFGQILDNNINIKSWVTKISDISAIVLILLMLGFMICFYVTVFINLVTRKYEKKRLYNDLKDMLTDFLLEMNDK